MKISAVNFNSFLTMCTDNHLLDNEEALAQAKQLSAADIEALGADAAGMSTFGKRGAALAYLRR